MTIPVLRLQDVPKTQRPLVREARLPTSLRRSLARIALRAPPLDDAVRWITLDLGKGEQHFAQPITFTPYASARPCSARCGFCSENLRRHATGTAAARLRPEPTYFEGLRHALKLLRSLPLSWSLSGLEASDDADWLLHLLETLTYAERDGLCVEQRVLYSNGAGLTESRGGNVLIEALATFGLDWIELSRHHFDACRNQALMRFRPNVAVQNEEMFAHLVRKLVHRIPIKLVCICQRDGICTAEDVACYLTFAQHLGVEGVIFRELARLSPDYRSNATSRYIAAQRTSIEDLVAEVFAESHLENSLRPERLTEGYYFWNLVCRWRDSLDVVFETADYSTMHRRHGDGCIYKLVYFANGELCAGWEPGQHVLWRADGQQ